MFQVNHEFPMSFPASRAWKKGTSNIPHQLCQERLSLDLKRKTLEKNNKT